MGNIVIHQTKEPEERSKAWRAIVLFLVITMTLSAVFQGLMIYQGQMTRMLVTATMWSPGAAAILACLILNRKISSLPWGWGEWRWNWYAWALPIAYGLAMYLPVWIFGLGGTSFGNEETLARWSSEIIVGDGINFLAVAFFVVVFGTIGVVGSAANALGEEIGWRGFMIWEFRKVMPFWLVVWVPASSGGFGIGLEYCSLTTMPVKATWSYRCFCSQPALPRKELSMPTSYSNRKASGPP